MNIPEYFKVECANGYDHMYEDEEGIRHDDIGYFMPQNIECYDDINDKFISILMCGGYLLNRKKYCPFDWAIKKLTV